MKSRLLVLAPPVASLVMAFVISSIVLLISGANPLTAFSNIIEFGFRPNTLVETLNWSTPLYLSAIAVAIGFRMNLFNIGVEGQYIIAAFMAAQVGHVVSLPPVLHVSVIIITAMVVGGFWAGLAGVLKVTRNINEVISTIMLNSIAVGGVVSYLLGVWDVPDPGLDTALGDIPPSGQFPSLNWLSDAVVGETRSDTWGFVVIAIIVGFAYHYMINRTSLGYDLRATGANPSAAEASGVDPKRTIVVAMVLSGMIAGLVGLPELLGDSHAYSLRFTQGLGFGGIAVALLGRNHAGGIAIAALLFGWLGRASGVLEVRGDAPREIISIITGVIMLSVVIAYAIAERYQRIEEAKAAASLTGAES
ncbi:MAG: ABC transporter permease [Actinomycetia bacterium]|nr:ABC transporter permease [Actinomycetes bacterium]MCP5032346.1 ABC transporter permease [Actinomycetes bacterium]